MIVRSVFTVSSDTPLIDHLVMREFVSGPPSYPSYTREFVTESPVLGKVREQFADLEQSSLRNDNFLGARSLFKFRVFEENSPFVD